MAVNETVGINLVADTRSLRAQLKEATQELARLQNTAGASAKEIANAAKRAAELKDRIGDAKATIEAFSPDAKFKAFSQSIQGVAGAFAGAQGALALFGVESENVQKQLLKVQAALALSEGLNTVFSSIDGFKNLALVIKTQVIGAFSTLKGAIIATGIGVLSIALGYVIANFEEIKKAIFNLIPGLSTLTDYVGTLVTKMTDFVGITSQADRELEKLGKTTKNRNAELENEIKLLEASGSTSGSISQKKKEIIDNEIKLLKEKGKVNGKLSDEELQKIQDFNTQKAIIDIQDKREIEKRNKEHLDKINADRIKAEQEWSDYQHSRYLAYEAEAKAEFEKRDKTNVNALQTSFEKSHINLENSLKNFLVRTGKAIEASGTKEVKIAEITTKQKIQLAGDAIGILSGMAEAGTDLQKGLALTQLAIDTGIAISGLTASTSAPSPDNLLTGGLSGFAKYATGLIKILANIAQAKNIIQSAGPNSSSNPSSAISNTQAPIVPQYQVPIPTELNQKSLNTISNVVTRAYVVESDITGTQKRIKRIENAARI